MSEKNKEFEILVIEDDEEVRDIVETSLITGIDFPVAVEMFDNAEDAIVSAKNKAYDFVIVDYKLPKMSGLDFIVNYRCRLKNDLVPIILISGYFSDMELDENLNFIEGVTFMSKPFEIEKIVDSIKNCYLEKIKIQINRLNY